MRLRRLTASEIVLGLLCLMYLITYMDRVNAGTAATAIKGDLPSSYLQLGFVISAWAYPYIVFQILGGWIGDRFGPRSTLFVCGLIWATATILTGFVGSLTTLFLARLMLGVGEGATFPVATRAMQAWTPPARRGFAQGLTHSFARFGNFVTPPIVAWLIAVVSWRGSFIATGIASLSWVVVWLWYFRDIPASHSAITEAELEQLPNRGQSLTGPSGRPVQVPWASLARRMAPVTVVYFCYGWMLWMYLNWLPTYFQQMYKLNLSRSAIFSSAVFAAGVVGDYLGGVISDGILKRTGDRRKARCHFVVVAFCLSFLSLVPMFVLKDLNLVVLSLAAAFFFAELVIGPMWAIPMDIAPKYSGTASGFMNTGSAVAAVLSPTLFGYLIDRTGNWNLPFFGSLLLLLVGAALAFTMHPETPLDDIAEGRLQTADSH